MSTTVAQHELTSYLSDAYSIEEQALQQLRAAPDAVDDAVLAAPFEQHLGETEDHKRQVSERLNVLGGTPSTMKSLVMRAGGMAFILFAESQPDTPGKLVAHAYSYEHMEEAAYELLMRTADRAGDIDTVDMARRIADSERTMAGRLEALFDRAVERSLGDVPRDDLADQLTKYLTDAHAIEMQSIQLLERGREMVDDEPLAHLMREHLEESRGHEKAISRLLKQRGAAPNLLKDAAMRLGALNWGAFFQAHPDTPGKLVAFAYAFEHLEIGGYEQLRRVAERAGDESAAAEVERLLVEERAAAEKLRASFDHAVDAALAAKSED
jgi:ferritin-like metal-binding protein YciE